MKKVKKKKEPTLGLETRKPTQIYKWIWHGIDLHYL
jgi:hypothetical protein